jgi:flagellar biosynthesis/type III secretory pathway chaperone
MMSDFDHRLRRLEEASLEAELVKIKETTTTRLQTLTKHNYDVLTKLEELSQSHNETLENLGLAKREIQYLSESIKQVQETVESRVESMKKE